MSAVRAWLDGREPPAPQALAEWLAVPDRPLGRVDSLVEAGRDALAAALARPGRDRGAAYLLLGADALITYACEAAVEERDVEAGLSRVLERVTQPR